MKTTRKSTLRSGGTQIRDDGGIDLQRLAILGQSTHTAKLKDQVTLGAELSEPAYGFLLAFRPDGVVDVCDPNDDITRPELTTLLQYPPTSATDKRFGLSDGLGLQAFAVVVSRQSLPSFRELVRQHSPCPWRAGLPGDPGIVWEDNGDGPIPFSSGNPKASRGKGETIRASRSLWAS